MALSDATARQAKDYTLGDSDGLSLGVTAARAGYHRRHQHHTRIQTGKAS
ncbi:hypothetical protein JET76_18320 [Pseudomonas putida]|nr:hypothetical protein [Pseudomonas putida]MBI6943298.1 hypothetical protein [Pseudomonas putida]MBI6959542.1 hypothetical protein [Pseudomonas putida]